MTNLVGKSEGRDHSEDPGIDGRIILKWTLRKEICKLRNGFVWRKIGTGGGLL
jgi:hypothetical protein